MTTAKRIYHIDCLRAVAIMFALLSHALTGLSIASSQYGIGLYIKAITRLATPALLIVFGMMIEIVYVDLFRSGPKKLVKRLVERSIDSALALLFGAALLAIFKGDLHPLLGLPLLYPVGYFTIFQLYVFLMPMSLALLAVRAKFGPIAYLPAMLAVWSYDMLISFIPAPGGWFGHVAAFFGIGQHGGPTPVHSLQFVMFGMLVGQLIRKREAYRTAAGVAATIYLVCLCLAAVMIDEIGVSTTAVQLADITVLRGHNHPLYYSLGISGFAALGILAVAVGSVPMGWFRRSVSVIGSNTFSLFLIGNALLLPISLGNGMWEHASSAIRVFVTVAFISASLLLMVVWCKFVQHYPQVMAFKVRSVRSFVDQASALVMPPKRQSAQQV